MTFLWIQKQLSNGRKFVNLINYWGSMQHKRKMVQWRLLMSADIAPWPQARHRLVLETSINGPLTSTGLSAREQQKQGCSTRENEPGAEGDTVQALTARALSHSIRAGPGWWQVHPQGVMVGQVQVYSASSSRRPVWRHATNTVGLGCIQGGQLVPEQQETGLGSATPTT